MHSYVKNNRRVETSIFTWACPLTAGWSLTIIIPSCPSRLTSTLWNVSNCTVFLLLSKSQTCIYYGHLSSDQ